MLRRFHKFARLFSLIAALAIGVVRAAPATETASARPAAPTAFDTPACSLEERLFADAADGRLDDFQPLTAALVASGVENVDDLRHYQEKAAALVEQLRRSPDFGSTLRDRANAILNFLHRRVFCRGYDLAYTDLRRVLDDGRFNCVSATVLFNYFAGELGLTCHGLEMPGHAMSRVVLGDGVLDVETTCPTWLRGNVTPQQPARALTAMIGSATTADHSRAREISAIQLTAMIYYNRGIDSLAEKRFAAAAALNAKAMRLDPQNALARGNLLATINNWSIDLGNSGEYAKAAALLRRGLAMDATFQPFVRNYIHVHRQWIDSLCRQGRLKEADDVLTAAIAEMPDDDVLRRMQRELRQQRAATE